MISEVFNVDCMAYMRGLPDKFFDLAIVDPEYGINEYGQRNKTGDRPTKKWKNPKSVKYKPFNDSAPPDKSYFDELIRLSVNQIIWGGNYFSDSLPISMGWIVWDKCVSENEHLSMAELAWSSFQKKTMKFEYLWAGFRKEEQITRIHPTQKPVALYKWLLKNYAKPGDKIFDSHMGSQSSRIAAYDMGFDYWGCELDADYFRDGCKRFEQFKSQMKLFT